MLGGCATYKMVPDGYTGPTVTVKDTTIRESTGKGSIFYVESINGNEVFNALKATGRASYGQGFRLTLVPDWRSVKVEPMKLKLIGTHVTAAPIHELASRAAGEFFSVAGDIDFSPVAGRTYVVNGALTKQEASVWIEDEDTKELVTKKIIAR